MKLLMLLTIIFISGCTQQIACTEEAMVCPDGSWTVRDPTNNCEFNPCPNKIICDYYNTCPEGYNCISFPDEPEPMCFISAENICSRCESNQCDYTESIPMVVECIE